MDKIWYLQGSDIFDGLAHEKNLFMSKSSKILCQKNNIIFHEGDPGDCCFYLSSGLVRIYSIHNSGKEPVFFLRHEGELFGVSEVLEGYPRNANAQAVSDVTAYRIGRNDFDALLGKSYPLARRIISLMGCRVRHLGDTVHNLIAGNVADRLASLLIALSYSRIANSDDWDKPVKLPFRISQEQLAQLAGTTQPTVSEFLADLSKKGLIKVEHKIITILSPKLLIASESP